MVSLFLSTALLIGTTACAPEQQVVYDQEGNPIILEEDDDDGFFGMFLAPFGFSKKHSSGAIRSVKPSKPSGITSGGSTYPNSVDSDAADSSGSTRSKTGIKSGSSSTAGSGITSGTHGGIGGGGSSVS
ncbi:MAG: hypothetical protein HGJ97_15095 [Desulfosporosinus sp.]|nr:hypothetical protein [Desulfosporosinus sp.]